MKKIFIFFLLLIVSVKSFSQKTFFSLGPELALPGSSYSLSMNAGTGFGGSFRIESSWGKHISGMATVSYLGFSRAHPFSSTPSTTTRVKAIPIEAGLKFYLQERKEIPQGFFISAEVGLMPTTTHFTYTANPDFNFKETGVSCAPGIGYQLGTLEAGFRLQYNLTASGFNVYYYDLRLAYSFLKRKDKN